MSFWEGLTCHELLKCVTKPINYRKKTANKQASNQTVVDSVPHISSVHLRIVLVYASTPAQHDFIEVNVNPLLLISPHIKHYLILILLFIVHHVFNDAIRQERTFVSRHSQTFLSGSLFNHLVNHQKGNTFFSICKGKSLFNKNHQLRCSSGIWSHFIHCQKHR